MSIHIATETPVAHLEEIAKAALLLVSDLRRYVSGANIVVDGAHCLR